MNTQKYIVILTKDGECDIFENTTKEDILATLEPVLLPYDTVPKFIRKTDVQGMDDVALCFQYQTESGSKQFVTRSLCTAFGITLCDLTASISGFTPDFTYQSLYDKVGIPIYEVTNPAHRLGAGLIMVDEVIVSMMNIVGNSDFYIIPTSIHEVQIIASDFIDESEHEILKILKSIPRKHHGDRAFLSEHIYKVRAYDCTVSTVL